MLTASVHVREFRLGDYEPAMALWRATEGLGLGESDTPESLAAFLVRNPGMSQVALTSEGRLVGAVLCGHDGRRGCLYHLAVARDHRGQGVGRQLVEVCLARLREAGIAKCNLFLFKENTAGRSFWLHTGWAAREDLAVLQKSPAPSKPAD